MIGLEVHAQVTSNAKLFSGASTEFGAEPNSQVSLVDAAMPGMLPVPNEECVRQAVRTGMALDAQINPWSRFDRKNYFYADLPQGYQISQLYHPIVGEGAIEIELDDKDERRAKTIGIERIHLEQDAGKLMHDQHPSFSYVDLNRSGVALMEIVSQARHALSRGSRRLCPQAAARSCAMSAAATAIWSRARMRADVNVSVRKPGEPFGTRTETKNVNSVRFIMAAIEYEANRQVDVLEGGGTIVQETRLFDPDKVETRSLRSKEEAHDYRYFPDPDLLPLELTTHFLARMPREPARAARRQAPPLRGGARPLRLQRRGADRRGRDRALVRGAARRDRQVRAPRSARQASNWVISDLFGALNRLGRTSPTARSARRRAPSCCAWSPTARSPARSPSRCSRSCSRPARIPAAIVEERGLKQTSDTGAIEAVIAEVLAANADKVAEYRGGKDKLFGFFVGQTMKAMAGQGQPAGGQRAAEEGAGLGTVIPPPGHPGLDPGSMNTAALGLVRAVFMDSGFRRNDGYQTGWGYDELEGVASNVRAARSSAPCPWRCAAGRRR